MARLGKYHLGLLFTVLCLILASLALIVTSITTDFWFKVSADDYATPEVKRNFSYSVGMWRRCYNKEMPLGVKAEDRAGDCVYTYKDLTRRAEDNMSSGEYRYLSLERSWVALMITAGGLQLFTIITLILGLWPMESAKAVKSNGSHGERDMLHRHAGIKQDISSTISGQREQEIRLVFHPRLGRYRSVLH
ncbi:hypothetical protein DPMN_025542 [Dreissena polymorpha]|uniref:Uncharacterized protein n=1 Tax=Dreissena polymorpha TaxID=45954 RepID=A0A9D4RCM8_DREPO|nr:hypothetical protein DPMN_025542 [Dreissena polymorpha]